MIGNFDVTTGELITPTIGPTRTELDFVEHIAHTVATDPEAGWIFVVDNLNIHGSEMLVRLVAKACGIAEPLGRKNVRGFLKSVASRQAFLSEKGHRIRFVYTPKHSSWLNQIETVFGVIMRKVIGAARSVRWTTCRASCGTSSRISIGCLPSRSTGPTPVARCG